MTNGTKPPLTKPEIRTRAKHTLAALSPVQKQQQSEHICKELYVHINTYTTRAVFIPFGYEPAIFPFVQQLWEHNKTVLLPQVHDDQLRLAHYSRDSIVIQWVHREWTIQDPVWYEWPLDVCLVPWLAFDTHWRRIGHGKWWYDRFLMTNGCYRIGVGFSQTKIPTIEHDSWDQKMDVVI